MSFEKHNIASRCLSILKAQGITLPTPIQDQAIPVALQGNDLVAVAQTGTGKTLAYCLPSITRLLGMQRGKNRMLVLAPTRELVQQVQKVFEPLCTALNLRSVSIFGGVGMYPQTMALRRGRDIIIATPGRLLDHMNRGNISFSALSILVLDEGDRMLDMGFLPDIRRIINTLPKKRQTMLFSATFPKEVERLANEFQNNPIRIDAGAVTQPCETVHQGVYTVNPNNKLNLLADILRKPEVQSAIVFIRTKHQTDRIAKALNLDGFKVQAIHGGRSQSQRDRALEGFRRGRTNILVATDVASRGIDVRGVTHVVNFDIPKNYDDYIHRIGRTARANESGNAITFVSPQEFRDLGTIERGLGSSLPQEEWEGAVKVYSTFNSKQEQSPKKRTRRSSFRRRPQRSFR